MSAALQRKLLEELMGKEALGGVPDNMKFTDPQVCKDYLCGLCPHDLFTNTKMDIGPCNKSHSPKLLEEYKRAVSEAGHPGFQEEWFRSLSEFVKDCDRKVDAAQRRLDKTPEDARAVQLSREIGDLTNEIATLTGQVETLGEEGKVTESMELMNKVEDLQKLKDDKERELKQLTGAEGNSQQQKLRVCEVCSAYLSIFDSDRRLADHFGGKMHMGFVKIRDQVDEMKKSGFSAGGAFGGGGGHFSHQNNGGNYNNNNNSHDGGHYNNRDHHGGGGDMRRGGYGGGPRGGYGGGGGYGGDRGGYGGPPQGGQGRYGGYDRRPGGYGDHGRGGGRRYDQREDYNRPGSGGGGERDREHGRDRERRRSRSPGGGERRTSRY
ncbi:uncharacterized protein EV422DRAFT_537920 [Fimicolochytrium jonesii]|uniref:uncharacterized protein n=1 Tax=Fimicolochytrium jonesii TaxID=1396493 RepID=UPI0022FE74BB|nr:uncharacterized protein EV422DRAFT_537920 [Fimicolochytrium jonesii]KAI8818283.1 hypothetical protein EV422DRAFT_537920 [Fimicolochytrium jonesii]